MTEQDSTHDTQSCEKCAKGRELMDEAMAHGDYSDEVAALQSWDRTLLTTELEALNHYQFHKNAGEQQSGANQ